MRESTHNFTSYRELFVKWFTFRFLISNKNNVFLDLLSKKMYMLSFLQNNLQLKNISLLVFVLQFEINLYAERSQFAKVELYRLQN